MTNATCERCQEYMDDARQVLSEDCAPDEKHCSCVPHLRTEIARLRKWVQELEDAVKSALDQVLPKLSRLVLGVVG